MNKADKIRLTVKIRNQNIEAVNRLESKIIKIRQEIDRKQKAIKHTAYHKLCNHYDLSMYALLKIIDNA